METTLDSWRKLDQVIAELNAELDEVRQAMVDLVGRGRKPFVVEDEGVPEPFFFPDMTELRSVVSQTPCDHDWVVRVAVDGKYVEAARCRNGNEVTFDWNAIVAASCEAPDVRGLAKILLEARNAGRSFGK